MSTYVEESLEEFAVRGSEADIDLNDLHAINLILAGLAEVGRVGVEHHATLTGRTFTHGVLTHTQDVATEVLNLHIQYIDYS